MSNDKRTFAIALAHLTTEFIGAGLSPDEALVVLQEKVAAEMQLQRTRRAAERSY